MKDLMFMNGNFTTVKEMIEFLNTMPDDALIYSVETIDGEAQDIYGCPECLGT